MGRQVGVNRVVVWGAAPVPEQPAVVGRIGNAFARNVQCDASAVAKKPQQEWQNGGNRWDSVIHGEGACGDRP